MDMIKPNEIHNDEFPVKQVPFMNKKGEWEYWRQLDTERVDEDTFSYMFGQLFENEGKAHLAKVKIDISMEDNCAIQKEYGSITTYASKERTRALRRQLKRIYKTGERSKIPQYNQHMMNVNEYMKEQMYGVHILANRERSFWQSVNTNSGQA
ncbi:hypothetical protein [Endozoicomonas sp. ALB115]|uniref:hypothetical protein n=1 Tax=Endozoicomonas sp. ALB115 TaxID=3403074 RepID=UPI003BB54485